MNDIELYYTQSTNLAAFLVMNGHEIVGKRKVKNVTTLYFKKSDTLHDCVREYNSDDNLKKFIAAFKTVKEILNK